ncbi:MAG: DNA-binding protein [Lachnospiraceae bacterium]|nr:DNA-binding protein [Lachnospiraceae bacterium]
MKDIATDALLCDFYGDLLKDHQREIFEASVMDDMSLSEIAQNFNMTRQAASDMLSRCRSKLLSFEDKLGLIKKTESIKEGLGEIKTLSDSNGGANDTRIIEIADRILGGL